MGQVANFGIELLLGLAGLYQVFVPDRLKELKGGFLCMQ
jgi:hypothetical protein